jgi:hypothetical protein
MKTIVNLMKEAGVESLDFIYHKNKPTVQKDGDKYEILSIYLEDVENAEDEQLLWIDGVKVYPSYEHKLHPLLVDSSWRRTSVNHIKNIVQQEINKLYL